MSAAKKQLINYIEFCYNRNPDYEASFLVNNFLFDHITEIQDLEVTEEDTVPFFKHTSANENLEKLIKSSLACFIEKYKASRADKVREYQVPKSATGSLENIFTGLVYSGNNDTEYKNLPSALSLATFNI